MRWQICEPSPLATATPATPLWPPYLHRDLFDREITNALGGGGVGGVCVVRERREGGFMRESFEEGGGGEFVRERRVWEILENGLRKIWA